MSLHEQLYQWTARAGLDASSARRLWQLSGDGAAPHGLWPLLRRGAGALGAGLIGFGVILWVAANWDALGRPARFALLQGLLAVCVIGAAARPAWRSALSLLGFLTLGGLLAFFGQTYQTGADTWQLFALWAALALPLAWASRSDLVWAPWALVAAVGILFWIRTHAGFSWEANPRTLLVHVIGLAACGLLCLGLAFRPGAAGQPWAWRTGLTASVMIATGTAILGMLEHPLAPQFWLGLGVLGAAAALAWVRREVYALCLLTGALDLVLVIRAAVALKLSDVLALLLLGLLASGLVALSVQLIVRRLRQGAEVTA